MLPPKGRRRAFAAGLIVMLGAATFWLYRTSTAPVRLTAEGQRLLAQAPAAARSAGCTGVRVVPPYAGGLDRAHIGSSVREPPPLSTYPSIPPASGPHDPEPWDAGVLLDPPPVYRAIHSLEHGAVIVWLRPDASGPAVSALRSYFQPAADHDHAIVAPYDYPQDGSAGALPHGRDMVLVAWHRIQLCRDVSLQVAVAFYRWYATPTKSLPLPWKPVGYRGEAPEAGFTI